MKTRQLIWSAELDSSSSFAATSQINHIQIHFFCFSENFEKSIYETPILSYDSILTVKPTAVAPTLAEDPRAATSCMHQARIHACTVQFNNCTHACDASLYRPSYFAFYC